MTLPLDLDGRGPALLEPPALRDYQNQALQALIDFRLLRNERFPYGGKRALITLPTGTGKTVVFAQLPRWATKRVLVIAHREELLDQAAEKLRAAAPGLLIGIEQAERTASKTDRVVVASIQTLSRPARLAKFGPREFSLIILDECHHATARTWLDVLAYFGCVPDVSDLRDSDLKALSEQGDRNADLERRRLRTDLRRRFENFIPDEDAPFLAGFSATPNRTDGRGLEFIFDEIVFSRSIRQMMEAGWLCPIRGVRVTTGTDISNVKIQGGDFQDKALANAVNTPERNAVAVGAYLDHARHRQGIVFCADVQHTRDLALALTNAGVPTAVIIGTTDPLERKTAIRAYKEGAIQALATVYVLTEGFDAPETSAILVARPTKSSLIFTQEVGRGTRIAPGKADLLVIDLVDAYKSAGVQTLNTLFGLPPKLDLNGLDALTAKRAMDDLEDKVPPEMLLDALSLSDVRRIASEIDPLRATTLEPWLEAATTLAWVRTGFGYALSVLDKGQLGVIVDTLGHSTVRLKAPMQEAVTLGRYGDPGTAMAAAEHWVLEQAPGTAFMLDRSARWRADRASDKQLMLLLKLKIPHLTKITKGEASALIDRHFSQNGRR